MVTQYGTTAIKSWRLAVFRARTQAKIRFVGKIKQKKFDFWWVSSLQAFYLTDGQSENIFDVLKSHQAKYYVIIIIGFKKKSIINVLFFFLAQPSTSRVFSKYGEPLMNWGVKFCFKKSEMSNLYGSSQLFRRDLRLKRHIKHYDFGIFFLSSCFLVCSNGSSLVPSIFYSLKIVRSIGLGDDFFSNWNAYKITDRTSSNKTYLKHEVSIYMQINY